MSKFKVASLKLKAYWSFFICEEATGLAPFLISHSNQSPK
jgi:hypothetical protein